MSHYRKAILLSPAHHVAMVNLGRLHRSLGQNKEAEVWYKRWGFGVGDRGYPPAPV